MCVFKPAEKTTMHLVGDAPTPEGMHLGGAVLQRYGQSSVRLILYSNRSQENAFLHGNEGMEHLLGFPL